MRALLLLGLLAAVASCSAQLSSQLLQLQAQAVNPTAKPITSEKLEELLRNDPEGAKAAYKECKQHGAACKVPCDSIDNCAGCHPSADGKATVCGYCMPGHVLSADQQSCTACPAGTTSKGGKATTCKRVDNIHLKGKLCLVLCCEHCWPLVVD
jgi:hypothetical protein